MRGRDEPPHQQSMNPTSTDRAAALDAVWTGPPSSADHLAWLDEQPAETEEPDDAA